MLDWSKAKPAMVAEAVAEPELREVFRFGVIWDFKVLGLGFSDHWSQKDITHRLHSSPSLGLPCRIRNTNPQKGTTMEPMGKLVWRFRYLAFGMTCATQ